MVKYVEPNYFIFVALKGKLEESKKEEDSLYSYLKKLNLSPFIINWKGLYFLIQYRFQLPTLKYYIEIAEF